MSCWRRGSIVTSPRACAGAACAGSLIGQAIVVVSLGVGMAGYRYFEGMPWVDAFANAAGTVVDTFQFADVFGTLAQNESEGERLGRELLELLSREISDDTLRWVDARVKKKSGAPAKVQVPTRIWFEEASSAHSTIVEIVARDRPGNLTA